MIDFNITIKDTDGFETTLNVSREEAEKLYKELHELFGEPTYNPFHPPTPSQPWWGGKPNTPEGLNVREEPYTYNRSEDENPPVVRFDSKKGTFQVSNDALDKTPEN